MAERPYDALILDLDGTLLDGRGAVRPRTREALDAARAAGVRVLVATGRSSLSAHPVLAQNGLLDPAVVFNGAAVYSPREQRMLEERVLSNRTRDRAVAFGLGRGWLTVLMCAGRKLSLAPRDEEEERALAFMTSLEIVEPADLRAEFVIRVTYLARRRGDSAGFAREVEAAVAEPAYLTHFPLSALDAHRGSDLQVVDLHPPCRGKAEALRVLEEHWGIPASRTVAVGDATNDLPMFEAAGLSVAMGDGMPEAVAAARRVIGGHDTDAIAELVEELFLGAATRPARAS